MSGTVASLTFTPIQDGNLVLSATFEARKTIGSDWGQSTLSKLFVTQDGVTTYSGAVGMDTTQRSQNIVYVFAVDGGLPVECGLYGDLSGAVAARWDNISILAQLTY